jgi:hypothetical protein
MSVWDICGVYGSSEGFGLQNGELSRPRLIPGDSV